MEFLPFKSMQPPSSHYGGEREQMLNLNQRLETYLNRVKLLDEENAKLAKEIQTLKWNHHGNQERRRFMDEELQCARREVDTMWKERVYAEVDGARLAEELQTLDLQLQRETQAHIEANAKAEQSRRELEEERRAQIWLTEKVNQLEHEMKSLIHTHQEEVANVEHMMMQTRVMPTMRPTVQQGPSLRELGEEYNQRAARAWQEAAEVYQGQLTRLEGSVNETRQRLVQVNQEKSESVMKLQNLDRELLDLHDLREHLESTVNQQRESHCRDIQMLQEHLGALESEKHVLAQKMDQLLQENRGLAQMKMSLNMEVATYRALLDNESLKGNVTLQKQPRNIYSKDAVFSPWGDHYQMSPSPKTTSLPPLRSTSGTTRPPVFTPTPIRYQKYEARREKVEISKEKVEDIKVFQQPELTPYPKVLKDGAVEHFRPQEVNEMVTYAEPLSPPDEHEKTLDLENIGDNWIDTVDQPSEEKNDSSQIIEAKVDEANTQLFEPAVSEESRSFSVKSEPMEKQNESEEFEKPQAPIDAWIEEEMVSKTEQPCVKSSLESSSNLEEPIIEAIPEVVEEASTEEVSSVVVKAQQETPSVDEEIEKPQEPVDAWVEKVSTEDAKAAQEQVESSDSETHAFVEPNFDTKSSSLASEESLQNQLGDFVQEEFTFDSVRASTDDTSPPKEKLYPDGEEMDTWDSVMEQNQGLTADDLEQSPEECLKQHAEPEEDISAKEVPQQMQEAMPVEELQPKFEPEIGDERQKDSTKEDPPEKSEEEEQEDSQNVSVSWQTELEGDSYAQDNTLADTRPLIRYKSDDTDGNTQASHIDDIDDSSDGEQDKKVGEMGSGMWIEDQTRRFGTMEDLCEEAEGEVLDEEYDLEYLRKDGKEDKEEMDTYTQEEHKTQEEVVKTVVEEELDTDKLVEQELENLTTEWYSTHFMHQQTSEKHTPQNESVAEEPIAWSEALEGMTETTDEEDFHTNETLVEQKSDEHFEEEPQQQKDKVVKEVQESAEVEEEDKHNVSMVTQCKTTEDITELQESVLSSTSQELSFENVSFEQKEPENMREQAEEVKSIGQDMPTPAEEEVQHSISMVTHGDITEDITELIKESTWSSTSQEPSFENVSFEQKEPENMVEQAEEEKSIVKDVPTPVEEEDKHSVSMVTHDDTTEDITEFKKELENMGEQTEEKELIDQDVLTTVEEEDKHSASVVTHGDTTEDITEFRKEPEIVGEQGEEKVSIVQDIPTPVEEEVKHSVSVVPHCDSTEDITEFRKEPEIMGEQAEEKESIDQDMPTTVEEEDMHNVSMVTHDDTTEDITELRKEPENMGEQAEEKESIDQNVTAKVEEEDKHSISIVTQCDTTEDITELRKESTWSATSQEGSFEQKEPENIGEQAEEKDSKDQHMPTTVEEEDMHNVSMVTHDDTAQEITELIKESTWSSTSQEPSFENVSFEQKEPENMVEQAEEEKSIVQDIPTPVEEEDKHSVSMVTHDDTTEDITEFKKEPENLGEQTEEKESIDQDVLTTVEEEDKHSVSVVTHGDTTEDITELRKESILSSTSQEPSFENVPSEQEEPENMEEQAEQKESIDQDVITKVEEEVKHSVSVVPHCDTTEDITEFKKEPEIMGEQAEEEKSIVQDIPTPVEEEDKHSISMVTQCDTTEDITELRKESTWSSTSQEVSFEQKEPENMGEQAEEVTSIGQDMPTPAEEEVQNSISMVTQCDSTEGITELRKEPESMGEVVVEKESVDQHMPTTVEEEDMHNVSMVTHCDTTEDITELRKESILSSTIQEPSFENVPSEQKEPENMIEQAEQKESIDQDVITKVEEEDKHSISVVPHCDTTEDITELRKEPENMGEQAEEKESIDQDVIAKVEEEDKHSISMVTQCDTTEDITELRKESTWSSTSQEGSFENVSFGQKEPENIGEQAEEKESIDQHMPTTVEEEDMHNVSLVTHGDTAQDITELIKESTWSSTSQEPSFENVSFEQKEPENMVEQAEEEKSIVQDIPTPDEEEDKHSVSMVTHDDTTEDITEFKKEPESMEEQAKEKESIGQDVIARVEEEDTHSISMVTHGDTTEDITESRKESTWSSTSQEVSFEQKEPENMGEQAEEKESIDQDVLTTVKEEDKYSVSVVTHGDTTEDITELRKESVLSSTSQEPSFENVPSEQEEPEKMEEQAEQKESIDQDVITKVEEEVKHSVSVVPHCDTTEDITEFRKEPEIMGEQAEEEKSIVQDIPTAVEEEDKHSISMVTQCDTTEDITELRKESTWSSTSQEVSFEQKEPENMGEQAEEVTSIAQDMPTPAEEEVQNSISMVTQCDSTEGITELRKEPESMGEVVEEKESIDQHMPTTVEEEDMHNVSMVTHDDTTEDITELRKEPENMGEQAEEKESIDQYVLTTVEEEDKHSVSMVTHCDTTEDITEFKKEPENMGEQAEEKDESIDQDMLTKVEEEHEQGISMVTHGDITEDITALSKESVLSSTSQEVSFEQKEPEKMVEQAEEKESIVQDIPAPVEEEDKHSVTMVTHCDTTEDITEFKKEPESMEEQAKEKESIGQDVIARVEEEDTHSISMVTHGDTTEDITESRKESTWSSTSQEVSFEQKEPENMGEQAEEKESKDQHLPTTVEEEDKHSVSVVTHGDTAQDITEFKQETVWSFISQEMSFQNVSPEQKESKIMEEQAEQKESIVQDIPAPVQEEVKHSVTMVIHCDTREDITEFRKEPESMEEQAKEKPTNVQDMLTENADQLMNENESNKLLLSSTVESVTSDNDVEMRDTTPEEIFMPEEADIEFPKALAPTEWEVLENPTENVYHEDKINSDLTSKGLCGDDKADHDSLSPTDEPLNMSPESVHEDSDLFIVKDSKELLKTNGKTSLDEMFSMNVSNDFWVSPLESGATYQPDDNKHAEWKLSFGDVERRETQELAEKTDMPYEQKEVTQIFTKTVIKAEIVHSEESEDDSEAMSSGEE